MSQEQLAEVLGLTRQTISKWELNQSTPDLQYILQMGEFFNVSLDYLIKGEEPILAEVALYECADDRVYTGLAGFLRGTQSQGIFAVLNLVFLSGIVCSGLGIFKQLNPTSKLTIKKQKNN